jgi:hypothetical protein
VTSDTTTPKTCVACKEHIPAQASVCSHCGSYQAAWKNHLSYLASIVGIVSLVAGAVTLVITSVPELRKLVAWHDEVQLVTFASNKSISITNTGDGAVYVTHMRLTGQPPVSDAIAVTERIERYLEPGDLATIDRDVVLDNYTVAATADPERADSLLAEATLLTDNDRPCVKLIFAAPNDPGYRNFSQTLGDEMVTEEADAVVQFYSIKRQTYVEQRVPMYAYVILWKDGRCAGP